MTISLSKGGNVSLTKEAPGLTAVEVGLGWDVRSTTGADFDLDASALITDAQGLVISDAHFIYYNNAVSPDGTVRHSGDNRTGDVDGDDEVVHLQLDALAPGSDKVVFAVSIFEAEARGQSFGQVQNAYIRVVDSANGTEIARYDLSEESATETAMVFGELYRHGAQWKFRAIGQGYASGLLGIIRDAGVNV